MLKNFSNQTVLWVLLLLLLFSMSLFATAAPKTIDDVSGLNNTAVYDIIKPTTLAGLQAAVKYARQNHLKISIAGKRHSQGGQILYKNALVIDMTAFNKILKLDRKNKILSVQAGATWEQVQNFLNPYALAIRVQQSSNIFTVGGSLSVNIHGRDPNYGSIIDVVRGFHLIQADGSLIYVSRTEHSELFPLVIGGFGLFGIITDVDIEVRENSLLEKNTKNMLCSAYSSYLKNNLLDNPQIELLYIRPDITPKSLFKDCVVVFYKRIADHPQKLLPLAPEKLVNLSKWVLGWSRTSDFGKNLRWVLQEKILDRPGEKSIISRNNAMRPAIEFLQYQSTTDTDVLQEYFIPISQAEAFLQHLKKIILDEKINLLNVTMRLVRPDKTAYLSYNAGNETEISFALYINHQKSAADIKKVMLWTQKIVDLALRSGGSYYLPYALYPTQAQIRKAYPKLDEFFAAKHKYDPDEIFINQFYVHYASQR